MIRVLPPPYIFTSAEKSLFRFSRISFFLNGRLNWFRLFFSSFHLVIRFWHLCQRFLRDRFGFFCLHWWFIRHFLWHALWTGQFRLNFRYFAAFCRLAGTTLERFIAGGWWVFAWSASHADVETAIPCEQNIMSEFWANTRLLLIVGIACWSIPKHVKKRLICVSECFFFSLTNVRVCYRKDFEATMNTNCLTILQNPTFCVSNNVLVGVSEREIYKFGKNQRNSSDTMPACRAAALGHFFSLIILSGALLYQVVFHPHYSRA